MNTHTHSKWMCMAQWPGSTHLEVAMQRLALNHLNNCLYSLRSSNVSGTLWLSESFYQTLLKSESQMAHCMKFFTEIVIDLVILVTYKNVVGVAILTFRLEDSSSNPRGLSVLSLAEILMFSAWFYFPLLFARNSIKNHVITLSYCLCFIVSHIIFL